MFGVKPLIAWLIVYWTVTVRCSEIKWDGDQNRKIKNMHLKMPTKWQPFWARRNMLALQFTVKQPVLTPGNPFAHILENTTLSKTCKLSRKLLQRPYRGEGTRYDNFHVGLHVRAKHRRRGAGVHKHQIESKYVNIRLQLLSSTYILVKKSEWNFPRKQQKVGVEFSTRRANGLPGVVEICTLYRRHQITSDSTTKNTPKLCITGPSRGKSTDDSWIPLTKG